MARLQVVGDGRLAVRRPTLEDLDVVFALHADPRTNVHNPAGPDPDRAASAARLQSWLDHWDEHGFGYWLVERLGDAREVVGVTGVQHSTWLEQPVLNLYYRYAVEHWGRGYATAGARHAVAWARRHRPGLPVLAYTTPDNLGSQRTARAAGLVRRPELEVELHGVPSVVFTSTGAWPAAAR